jgi:hypothetical protein
MKLKTGGLDRFRGQGDGGKVTQIAADWGGFPAGFGTGGGGRFQGSGGADDMRAAASHNPHRFETEAGRAAGQQYVFAGQVNALQNIIRGGAFAEARCRGKGGM